MILWTAIFVVVGGVTAALGGALAIAADQSRQEEEAVACQALPLPHKAA